MNDKAAEYIFHPGDFPHAGTKERFIIFKFFENSLSQQPSQQISVAVPQGLLISRLDAKEPRQGFIEQIWLQEPVVAVDCVFHTRQPRHQILVRRPAMNLAFFHANLPPPGGI